MTRAYSARLSTVQLAQDLRECLGPDVSVRIVAPTAGTHPRPARIRIVADACATCHGGPAVDHGVTNGYPDKHPYAAPAPRYLSLAEARTELAYRRAIAYATATGARDGANAIDSQYLPGGGRSSATAAAGRRWAETILRGMDDGDPAVMDGLPSADLSGEWAGTLTGPELVADAAAAAYGATGGYPHADDWFADVCDAYESAFADAVAAEMARLARAALEVSQ